jgi:hypothetical protein
MVHWLGEGSDVMICLARDPPLGPNDDPNTTITAPSTSEFISVFNLDFIIHFLLFLQFLFLTITVTRFKIKPKSFNSTKPASS